MFVEQARNSEKTPLVSVLLEVLFPSPTHTYHRHIMTPYPTDPHRGGKGREKALLLLPSPKIAGFPMFEWGRQRKCLGKLRVGNVPK